ncbi:MAG: flagellar export chaperone FliS [Treponemataceae bacterium]|nr:flagellar export chaperone FliS [Treponemataceae bacterium]
MYNQAYNAYKKASVKTASPAELIVLLYEGAIKKLASASSKFTADGKLPVAQIESFSADILRAQEIITELEVSLDMEQGGQIAQNLMSLYLYFNDQLRSANISRSKEKVDFVQNMMSELSATWKKAAENTVTMPSMQRQQTLNIQS